MVGCALLCQLPEAVLDDALENIHDQLTFHFEDLEISSPMQTVLVTDGYSAGIDGSDDPAYWE
jgi:hypothetical protein